MIKNNLIGYTTGDDFNIGRKGGGEHKISLKSAKIR